MKQEIFLIDSRVGWPLPWAYGGKQEYQAGEKLGGFTVPFPVFDNIYMDYSSGLDYGKARQESVCPVQNISLCNGILRMFLQKNLC